MDSYLSAKKVLSTILLNTDTNKILDEYIISYLKLNPSLVTEYINDNGLYNVYIRSMDKIYCNDDKYMTMDMIQSFGTQKDAENWIIIHGKKLVENYDSYYKNKLVLIIIHHHVIIYNEDNSLTNLYSIAEKKFPTYTFSDDAVEMLLDEAEHFGCTSEYQYWVNPRPKKEDLTWVTFL